jgi:hypothetical protein
MSNKDELLSKLERLKKFTPLEVSGIWDECYETLWASIDSLTELDTRREVVDSTGIRENTYSMSMLKEAEFKSQYIATFLASYMAGRYDSDCMNGTHGTRQPVEDANFLANEAWEEVQKQSGIS